MVFRPSPFTEQQDRDPDAPAEVDYRMTRQASLRALRAGELSRHDACDAHPELVRAGREIGVMTTQTCPVCDDDTLRHVTYVFGPRLPKHGRCISLRGELARIGRRKGTFVAYVVEVCPACHWNHLVKRYVVPKTDGGGATADASPVG